MMYMHHMTQYPDAPSDLEPLQPGALIEVCLCHHSRRAARAVTRAFDEAFQPLGLKASQFNILVAVGCRDGASATAIAAVLAMDRTTLSRNLRPLRDAGYLEVDEGAGRRAGRLALTPAGRTLLRQATGLWRAAQGRLTRNLGAGQAGVLIQSLEAATRAAHRTATRSSAG